MDTLDRMPFKARKAIFERLERIGSMANLTPKQRAQYEAEWKMYNDYYNTLDFAVEKGMKKGMEEGMEKGLQKGLQEGLQKGKESTARNMKAEGITPLIIQKCIYKRSKSYSSRCFFHSSAHSSKALYQAWPNLRIKGSLRNL